MKNSNLSQKLTEAIFNCSLNLYPKYKLVDGGERIMIELAEGKFKSLGLHHISENGVLCDDMETFIEWEKFSK